MTNEEEEMLAVYHSALRVAHSHMMDPAVRYHVASLATLIKLKYTDELDEDLDQAVCTLSSCEIDRLINMGANPCREIYLNRTDNG